MRKRNYTVTVRMNKVEYELLQRKVRESGRTQQAVVIAAIAELKIASTEEIKELKRLNELLAEILRQLRGAASNINQIARRVNATGTIYAQDIEDIKGVLNEIWLSQRSILSKAP